MATFARASSGGDLDSRVIGPADWIALKIRLRAGQTALTCGNCRTPLLPRDAVAACSSMPRGRVQHFYHPAGAPRSCTNIDGEPESEQHRTLKHVVAGAFAAVRGITAAVEYSERDDSGRLIRADVVALREPHPVSLAEVQTSRIAMEDLVDRTAQRQQVLDRGPTDAARTVPWFTPRAGEHYGKWPFLYLSKDGQRVMDGLFDLRRTTHADTPIECDVDRLVAGLVAGTIYQIGDVGGGGMFPMWVDSSLSRTVKSGKRRRRAVAPSDEDRAPTYCERSTATGAASPAGPCRVCGEPAWRDDDDGPAHPCCVFWATEAAGRPCLACAESRRAVRQGTRRWSGRTARP